MMLHPRYITAGMFFFFFGVLLDMHHTYCFELWQKKKNQIWLHLITKSILPTLNVVNRVQGGFVLTFITYYDQHFSAAQHTWSLIFGCFYL